MLPFVIERLIISGLGKTDSVIEFSDGLTFVVGPSNTGKSHVMDGIDYLFGFSESATNPFRFEKDWGYSAVMASYLPAIFIFSAVGVMLENSLRA